MIRWIEKKNLIKSTCCKLFSFDSKSSVNALKPLYVRRYNVTIYGTTATLLK